MPEFDDVNRYFASMRHVFYSLLAIADEARGREPRRVYRPFEEDPDLFFDDAYSAVVDAGAIVDDDELLPFRLEFLHAFQCWTGREVTSIEALLVWQKPHWRKDAVLHDDF
ncbi:hypothetical protein [Brevibacterium sp. HMSC24B04]|uniref:hypothetical protein n=1 Tax=Brevibacterium sp. HMSC24B04 TaxID=1581060 RepID=UPI000AB7143B|nr:hypothetical protein [Brevibacterium sp. HMSC24B04]